jgi:hypothetical protein
MNIILFFTVVIVGALLFNWFMVRSVNKENTDLAIEKAEELALNHIENGIHNNPYIFQSGRSYGSPTQAWLKYESTMKNNQSGNK